MALTQRARQEKDVYLLERLRLADKKIDKLMTLLKSAHPVHTMPELCAACYELGRQPREGDSRDLYPKLNAVVV